MAEGYDRTPHRFLAPCSPGIGWAERKQLPTDERGTGSARRANGNARAAALSMACPGGAGSPCRRVAVPPPDTREWIFRNLSGRGTSTQCGRRELICIKILNRVCELFN